MNNQISEALPLESHCNWSNEKLWCQNPLDELSKSSDVPPLKMWLKLMNCSGYQRIFFDISSPFLKTSPLMQHENMTADISMRRNESIASKIKVKFMYE